MAFEVGRYGGIPFFNCLAKNKCKKEIRQNAEKELSADL
jgi:hypothetical protein